MPSWGTVPKSCTSWPTCILLTRSVIYHTCLWMCVAASNCCTSVDVAVKVFIQGFKPASLSIPMWQPVSLTHWLHLWAFGRSTAGHRVADASHQCNSHRPPGTGQTGGAVWWRGGQVPGFPALLWGTRSITECFYVYGLMNSFNISLIDCCAVQSFRYYPSNIDVIEWLGAYYIETQFCEKAIQYFERATLIQ